MCSKKSLSRRHKTRMIEDMAKNRETERVDDVASMDGGGGTSSTPQIDSITVEDLVQATVRAMIMHEQAKNGEVSQNLRYSANAVSTPNIKNSEIAALLPEFSGTKQDVDLWLERVDSVCNVPDQVVQLVAVGKFCEVARDWYLSNVEYISMDWNTLKNEMRKLFVSRYDKVVLRRKFEGRTWKRGEKFSSYFHEKLLLGNSAGVSETDMLDYVIDGFDDVTLQNQARMQNFDSLEKLLTVMKSVADRTSNTTTGSRFPRGQVFHQRATLAAGMAT